MFTLAPPMRGGSGDQFFANVALLLHCDGTPGTAVYVDSSSYARTLTETGTNALSAVQVKFGATSALFNDGAIQVPDSPSLELGAGAWTIEWQMHPTSHAAGILAKYFSATPVNPIPIAISCVGTTGSEGLRVRISSDGATYGFDETFPSSGGGAYNLNTWSHMAVTFDGTTMRAFRDGSLLGSAACATAVGNSTNEWQIGRDKSLGTYMNGYLDEIRITVGVARYTAAFTPPSKAFPDS